MDITLVAGKLNNRQDSARLGKIEENSSILSTLVACENIDIDNHGEVSRRLGRELIVSGDTHSFWVHPADDSIAYFVENTLGGASLKKLNNDFTSTVVTALSNNSKIAYEPVNEQIVISNGVDIGWLDGTSFEPFAPTLKEFELTTPAGQYLCFYRGVLHVAVGSVMFASKPHNIEVMDERYMAFPMDGHIRMLGAVEDGMWIATGKGVGWISGTSVEDYEYVPQTKYAPPDGCFTVQQEDTNEDVRALIAWASEEGFCRGYAGGQYENQSDNDITLPNGESGKMFHFYNNGIRQYIAVIDKPVYKRNFVAPTINTNELTI